MSSSDNRLGSALCVVGAVGVVNALLASSNNAEKNPYMHGYVNTHWITTIVLFAGLSQFLAKDWNGRVLSFCCQLLSICIAICACGADLMNILLVLANYKAGIPKTHLLIYNLLDALLCVGAIVLNNLILRNLSRRENELSRESPSRQIEVLGYVLFVVSLLRCVNYSVEVITRDRLTFFLNYTLDEPAWAVIGLAVAHRSIRVGRYGPCLEKHAVLALSTVLIVPAVFFLWLDYRWFTASQLTEFRIGLAVNAPFLMYIQMALTLLTLVVLLCISLTLLTQIRGHSYVVMERSVQLLFLGLAGLLFFLSILCTFIDVYSLYNKMFYRWFHATEQKTPIYTAVLALFSLLTASQNLQSLAMPICITASLFTVNSTLFQLFSYIYLSYHQYLGKKICESFFMSDSDCLGQVTKRGAMFHLAETLTNVAVLVLALTLCAALMRLARLRPDSSDLLEEKQSNMNVIEKRILALGVLMCIGSLVLVSATIKQTLDYSHKEVNILVYIYTVLFHISIAVGLVIFPLFQILVSERLHRYPLFYHALLCISVARFTEILTQLDYRGTGDDLTYVWIIHQTVDFIALGAHFFTAHFVIQLMSETNNGFSPLEQFPLHFDNPLTLSNDPDEGYIQLRQEETA